MKFTITMKNPDCVSNAIDEAVEEQIAAIEGLDEDELELARDSKREKLEEFLAKWVRYMEYITIEFDTEKKTATVCKADR